MIIIIMLSFFFEFLKELKHFHLPLKILWAAGTSPMGKVSPGRGGEVVYTEGSKQAGQGRAVGSLPFPGPQGRVS